MSANTLVIYLKDPALKEIIKQEASKKNESLSEYISNLVLENHNKNKTSKTKNLSILKKMSGIIKTGGFAVKPEDLSKEIDKIVYDI